jgi:hypothetical protein
MSGRGNVPTLSDVAEKLRLLVVGEISRQQASEWASPWITEYTEVQFDTDRELDRRIKKAFDRLASADSISTDRPYLYGQSDFERWLNDLTS